MGKGPLVHGREVALLGNYARTPFYAFDPDAWTLCHFSSVEHYFQYNKVTSPHDKYMMLSMRNPVPSNRLGRMVALRPGWDERRVRVMVKGALYKCLQNPSVVWALFKTIPHRLVFCERAGAKYFWDEQNQYIWEHIRRALVVTCIWLTYAIWLFFCVL